MVIKIDDIILNKLTQTERTVVDYINLNESNIPNMSIVDVAEKTFTSPELVESAKSAILTGAKLITCCCINNSELEKISDITLIGYKQAKTSIKEFEVTSRLPLFVISRAIIDYLII